MIKERIIQLIEYKRFVKEVFFKKIGVTSANFRGMAKNTPVNSNTIENIFTEIPDLNLEWLITGRGEMLKENDNTEYKNKYISCLEEKDILHNEIRSLTERLNLTKNNVVESAKSKS